MVKTQKEGLLKPTIQITILSFAGIILSFISQLIIAYYFGANTERDAYFAAIVVPTYLTAILTGSIGFIFLPQVIELRNISRQNARKFINTILGSTTLCLLILIIFGIFFSKSILNFTAPGFDSKMVVYTVNLFRILLFTSLFSVLTNLISYLYQIKQKFIRPALAPLINIPIIILLVVILNSKIGIISLAIGTLIGSIISFLFVLPILFTKECRFSFHFDISNSHFISMLKVLLPLLVGGIVFRSAPVFERMIASGLTEGSISILGYSGQLLNVLITIATSGIIVSFFPSMSDAWSKDMTLFIQYFNKGIRSILILTIPIALSFILFGDTFIKTLLERGAFTAKDTFAVSKTFAFMTPAYIVLCLGGITSKVFYISKRTLDLTIIASLELLSYLLLSYFLSRRYGYLGIAMGTSIAYSIFMLIYYFYVTTFIIKEYNYTLILVDIVKITLIALFSFGFSFLIFNSIKNCTHIYIAVGISLLFAFTLYLLLLIKFKNIEIITLINKIKK
ncbi:MAG: polysaccharide biosynthesis C-terminal domain-containing protein [Bacteroidetes bacterium]|nr:polysaccharide biosynthesis C-terminal domain-containing protein [Bacteroidota bacterium]